MKKTQRAEVNNPPLSPESRDIACFHQGTHARAWEYFGAHPVQDGCVFRVWAPGADFVSVCGDFNGWSPDAHPMKRISHGGIWEVTLPAIDLGRGRLYKYFLRKGETRSFKTDPFGVAAESLPGTASAIRDVDDYPWRDDGWLRYRKGRFCRKAARNQPINIYEIDISAWRRHGNGGLYSYRDAAADLIPYVKQMGYTHAELLLKNSFYAPDPRFGAPEDLMAFVDSMHEAGIGVILGWNPICFSPDEHGLLNFDGQPLYESADPSRRNAARWGARFFDVEKREVQSFLISSAMFWAEKYHADGLRMDDVAALLWLDYDKNEGEWTPNRQGDNRAPAAISFLQKLNSRMSAEFPDVMMITKDSSAWKSVTGFEKGGLGFTFKWDETWTHNSMEYLREDPLYRHYHHSKMTHSVSYAGKEAFLLPISQGDVKNKSLMEMTPGDTRQKFANQRVQLVYQMTHPGKKLLTMGCELGRPGAQNGKDPIEWGLLEQDPHAGLQLFASELNRFYLSNPPLWEQDGEKGGFDWIDEGDAEKSIYSYRRRDAKGRELIILLNFLPVRRENFLLDVPEGGVYEEVFNSDATRYGGGGIANPGKLKALRLTNGTQGYALCVDLPPMSGLILRCQRRAAQRSSENQ